MGALRYTATVSGEIRCWFFGTGQMPPAVRPELLDVIDRTPGSKIAGIDDEALGPLGRNELVDLNFASRGGGGALYLSTEGAGLRRAFRALRRRGEVISPFAKGRLP